MPHARHLQNHRWIIQKPPAPENHQIPKLAGGDAEFMLVFAGEHRAEEFVVGEGGTEADDGLDVGLADHVAGVAEGGVYAHQAADHHG